MAQKWILENNILRFGNVGFHKKLAKNENDVLGGGLFKVDHDTNSIELFGKSIDRYHSTDCFYSGDEIG
jgi:hypothetical protein